MKKNLLIMVVALLCIFSIGGFFLTPSNISKNSSDKLLIVTTLYPLYDFVKEVGQERVDVTLLLPPGVEAHSFEPKPSDIVKINNADMFLYVGAEMEPWAHDIIEGAGNEKLTPLDASSKVSLLKSGENEENDHEGEAHSFEWAGIFELKAGTYKWSFAKVQGEYADPAMKMIIQKSEDIESIEQKAKELMGSKNQDQKKNNDIITPKEVTYLLNFNEEKEITVFTIEIAKDGKYVFFTEHMPTEFESDEHFFKDSKGNDIEPIMTEPESEDHHDHHHGEYDPHFWLDFENDQKIVIAIADLLSKKDPANKDFYMKNGENYNKKLEKLHANYLRSLSQCKQNQFISGGHNAFNYLARKYNLKMIAAYGISPDSEPTPKKIKGIIDLAKEHRIKYIYFEKLISPKMAETIASEVGMEVLVLSPAHNLQKEQFQQGITFISLMEENLNSLKIGLECT
ncbi:hypothetical protein FJZ22_00665 [Candidatus Pacearchaeota archaeon]|nr:hypothetical protein [Candidatus Pacearchaeota archaeon]